MQRNRYSDDQLLQLLKEKAKELGRTPTRREVREFDAISRRFGSWNQALQRAGLPIVRKFYTEAETYEALHQWVKQHGKVPSLNDWIQTKAKPENRNIQRQLNLTWNQFLIKAGYEINGELKTHEVSKETLLTEFKNLCEKLDRAPTYKEVEQMTPYTRMTYRYHFGSWYELSVLAGYPVKDQRKVTKKEIIKKLLEAKTELGRRLTYKEVKELELCPRTVLNRFHTMSMKKVWEEIEGAQ